MDYKLILSILFILLILIIMINYKNIENFTQNNFEDIEFYVLYISKREQYIKNIMKNFSFKPNYILGPKKNNLSLDYLIKNNIITSKYAKKNNIGRIACHLGHLKILEEFMKTDKKYAIIFEDDIRFDNHKKIEKNMKNVLSNLPDKFDIIYFDYCWSFCKKKNYNKYLDYSNNTLCRHFYLITKNGAKIILNNTLPMYKNGDEMYVNLQKNNKLITYDVKPNIFNIQQNRILLGSELNNNGKISPPKCVNKKI